MSSLEQQSATLLPTGPEIRAIGLGEFLELKLPERELLLSPWLPAQGLVMVFAPRGVGKTFFGLNVAYALASGGNFLGWSAKKPHSVLYIDGEMPAAALQERMAAIVLSNEKEAHDFKIITPDFQKYGVPDLSTKQGQNAISEFTEKADLIVVDSISTLCRTGIENDAESWLSVQEWALGLRAKGKTVLFIHHAGKSGQQRGTSRREDVLDTVINLTETTEYSPEDGARFQVSFTKFRGFYGKEAAPFEVTLTTGSEGRQAWIVKKLTDCTYLRTVELAKEGMTQAEIARELGVHRSTVCKHTKKAKREGLL